MSIEEHHHQKPAKKKQRTDEAVPQKRQRPKKKDKDVVLFLMQYDLMTGCTEENPLMSVAFPEEALTPEPLGYLKKHRGDMCVLFEFL
jgi:hypothetical protein